MRLSLRGHFLSSGGNQPKGFALIDKIAALAQSSQELNTALRCAAGEISRALGVDRVAILLRNDGEMRRASDYSSPGLGQVERERLRQFDFDVTREIDAQPSVREITTSHGSKVSGPLGSSNRAKPSLKWSVLIGPIVIDSEATGAVLLYRKRKRRWSSAEKQLVQAAASTLSITVHHFHSQERAASAADREGLTNRLLSAIRSAVDVNKILDVAVDGIGATLKVSRVVIYRRNGGGAEAGPFTARAEYRSSVLVPSLLGMELDLEGSPLLERLMSGEIIDVPDTNESDPVVRAICVRLGVRAMALAPVSYNGHTVATIALEQFDHPRVFSSDELKTLELVTEQTAVALYQAELYREAQEAARRDALISKISSAVHRSLNPEVVLQTIVDEMGAALGVCRCRLALLPSPMPEMVPVTHEYVADCCMSRPPVLNEIQTINNTFLQKVLSLDEPMAVSDPIGDPILAPVRARVEAGSVKAILTAAIRLESKPIGILSLHHCEHTHQWTRWEIDLVKSISDQAAVAIRQVELYREVHESARRASLVNEIVASIRSSLDLNETLQVAVQEVGLALGANRTYFRQITGTESAVVAEYLSDPKLSLRDVASTADDYIISQVVETGRTLVIDDVRAFSEAYPELASTVRIWRVHPMNLSQIVCPVFVNGKCAGVISIGQIDRARKWTASEIALVEMVAAQVEVAVSHSHLFQETKQAAEREALISHIIHGVNESNRLDEIFPIVARKLGDHLSADKILIMKRTKDSDFWTAECEYCDGEVSRPERTYRSRDFQGLVALLDNDLIVCEDAQNDSRLNKNLHRMLDASGTRSFLSLEVLYSESALVITALMKSGPRSWTQDEIDVLRAAANQVVIAMERAELFEMISHGKVEWEATFDALSDGIFIFDEKGVLIRVNEAAAAFEGASVHDLIGRRCCSLLQGVEGETCRVAQVVKSRRPATFELVPERLSRPVLVTISPLVKGSDARRNGGDHSPARGAVCIVRDLSELRAAEAAAREQRSFLVKLIEHANDAILAFSPEGRLIWFNEQLIKHSGYSRAELEAGDYRLFVFGDQKKLAKERFMRALEGDAQTFELGVARKNGEKRLLLITHTPIYDEGHVSSVLSIARDVTEERLASERAAHADKLRALGKLASGVAHNFNNVLAAILGHTQLIKRDCDDDTLGERLNIIEQAALDGAQTVRRIQAFGLQQNEGTNDSIDLGQLLADSTTLTRARWCDEAQARGLHYDVELSLENVPLVRGSSSELREVFVNIILNALDAMPQGGNLRISAETGDEMVNVSFTDNGIGMSSEVAERIFEPFFTTKGTNGTGLGLAVSYSIIERHGGRIEASSSPGRGTTFTVSLPVADGIERSKVRNDLSGFREARVLVVDDDQRVREALVDMLNSAGHRTHGAGSGHEALAKLESGQFDLVFTDLSMPEMDGWAIANEIRRRWPDTKVVLVTGYAVPPETVSSNRQLVNDVMFKPIQFEDLNSTLRQVLS